MTASHTTSSEPIPASVAIPSPEPELSPELSIEELPDLPSSATPHADPARTALIEAIIKLEWGQFQETENEGGRASCQNNFPTFHQMRYSQFATWSVTLLTSYQHDLEEANRVGSNLITEKYARMMASTAPIVYHERIEPYLAQLSPARRAQQEAMIAQQVQWAKAFRERYPKLGHAMRVLTTAQDSEAATSFETYLRGELSTYSQRTLDEYQRFLAAYAASARNLTQDTLTYTVLIEGYASLEEAERAQP